MKQIAVILTLSLLMISCSKATNAPSEDLSSSGVSSNDTGTISSSIEQNSSSNETGVSSSSPTSSSVEEESSSSKINSSSSNEESQTGYPTFIDSRDGKSYEYTTIGTQVWMTENLNHSTDEGSWCLDGLESNCDRFGRLYNWISASAGSNPTNDEPSGVQGVCPDGWHLPSKAEWETLATYITEQRKVEGNEEEDFGISVLLGGYRHHEGEYRTSVRAQWWTITQANGSSAYYQEVYQTTLNFFPRTTLKSTSYSVRCVKGEGVNTTPSSGTGELVDSRDGKTYKTTVIGNATWMSENLNYDMGADTFCYGNVESNCDTYGRMYTWAKALQACPTGWHLSSRTEWITLGDYVAYSKGSLDKEGLTWTMIGSYLRADSGWDSNGNGTDDFVFSALPGGRSGHHGGYLLSGEEAYWWTTESSSFGNSATYYKLTSQDGKLEKSIYDQSFTLSVRCVQDYI